MIVKNVRNVLAIELLNNTQAYEFRKDIDELSIITGKLYSEVRKIVPPITKDRPFYVDMANLSELILSESVVNLNS
jgi:histidine ammonia-lyase